MQKGMGKVLVPSIGLARFQNTAAVYERSGHHGFAQHHAEFVFFRIPLNMTKWFLGDDGLAINNNHYSMLTIINLSNENTLITYLEWSPPRLISQFYIVSAYIPTLFLAFYFGTYSDTFQEFYVAYGLTFFLAFYCDIMFGIVLGNILSDFGNSMWIYLAYIVSNIYSDTFSGIYYAIYYAIFWGSSIWIYYGILWHSIRH